MVDWMASLAQRDVAKVAELAERARVTDGVGPLSEQAMFNLASEEGESIRHLIIHSWSGDFTVNATAEIQLDLAAYAQLDLETGAAELVVAPKVRQRGLGSRLLAATLQRAASDETATPCAPLRVWSHGDLGAAQGLAEKFGLQRARTVLQMFRLAPQLLPEEPPAGITDVFTFKPGRDELEWLALNVAAFGWHPEQGRLTHEDLLQREDEEWFDPGGFFLARDEDGLAGFVWTKLHDVEPPVGEIYVVGVHPRLQRQGLGAYLTRLGMRYLAQRGAQAIMLYVESDNEPALRAYQKAGFQVMAKDVQYVPGPQSAAIAAAFED